MWAVLTAVLGGTYFAGKMSSERSASKEATQKREEWKRLLDEWCVNITDERLESRLETYIQRNPFEAAEKAKSICQFIPEDQQNPTTYLRILLSNEGKIRKQDAIFGIETPLYVPKPVLTAKQKYRDFFEFVIWLNRNLERHGASTGEVLFVPSYPAPDSKKYYSTQEAGRLLVNGTYVWAPQRICVYLDKK